MRSGGGAETKIFLMSVILKDVNGGIMSMVASFFKSQRQIRSDW
jgi:hypothetical protein